MSLNLGMILAGNALERGAHPAIRQGQRSLSYAELDRLARSIAAGLHGRGLGPGDHVAIMLPNVPEFTMAYFGALYAGCTVVPLNVLLTAREITYHLQDSEARLLIAHEGFAERAAPGAEAVGVPVVWAGGERRPGLAALCETAPLARFVERDEHDTAVILYTSGTTGRAKGAELTHTNLLLNCSLVVARLMKYQADDVALAVLPLFHSFGQTCIQNAVFSVGGTILPMLRFDAAAVLDLMERERVTIFAGVPTMYFDLLNHPGGEARDITSLRVCNSGGAPLPVEVLRGFEQRFRVKILEGYGLSETSPAACFNRHDLPRKAGSIGYPVWGVDMRVVDPSGQPVPDDTPGEICIRGHNIMKGYWKRPEATAEAIRDGWFHSGDIGIRESDGTYRIIDRTKDMIIRGGFNVYPRELEEVLYEHPAIAEAAVVGVPDARFGEEVKAIVVLAPDQKLGADELIAYMRERVAANKYPRLVEFRTSLPRGPTGKILKRELREQKSGD
jgi:long-chain acyl-CoA synthetase